MKNKILGLIVVFTISISTNINSQSAEDLAMMEAMFNTAVDSGVGDQSGQAQNGQNGNGNGNGNAQGGNGNGNGGNGNGGNGSGGNGGGNGG